MHPLSSNTPLSLIPHEARGLLEDRLISDEGGSFNIIPFPIFVEKVCCRYLSILQVFKCTSKLFQEILDHVLPRELFTFGTRDWQLHYAQRKADNTIQYADTDEEPILPALVLQKLHESIPAPHPKCTQVKVHEVCLLVLIPKTINDKNYCFDILDSLMQHPLDPTRMTKLTKVYGWQHLDTFYAEIPTEHSYYVLMSTHTFYNANLDVLQRYPGWGGGKPLAIATCIAALFVKTGRELSKYTLLSSGSGVLSYPRAGVGLFSQEWGLSVGTTGSRHLAPLYSFQDIQNSGD